MPSKAEDQLEPEVAEEAAAEGPSRVPVLRTIGGWGSALLCLVVLVALAVGYGPMRAKAAGLSAGQPRVEFEWPPLAGLSTSQPPPGAPSEPRTWVNAEIRAELESLVLSKLGTDPFDRAALAQARDALATTGWLQDDLRLTRDLTGFVHVTGTWRVPVAAVRSGPDGGQDMLVSPAGELLPVKYRPGASGYKVILGASQDPPERGKPWVGGDVQAGLKLLELLRSLPGADQIAGVDVSDYGHGRNLALITDVGNRILWGGPVDDFNPGQAPPEVKAARLAQVYSEYGRIDAGRTVIDVRLIDGVYIHDTAGVMARAQQGATPGRAAKAKPKSAGSR